MTTTEIAYFVMKLTAYCVLFVGIASWLCHPLTPMGIAVIIALVIVSCVTVKDKKSSETAKNQ